MANSANEKVKRRYFKWLRGARGYSEQTIVAIERAIHLFEEFTGYKDLKTFCERQATNFKSWMEERRVKGQSLSNSTKYHHIRHLNAFFSWLATQHGYKSRISLDSVSYLSLDKRAVREALTPRPKPSPSLENVKSVVESIVVESDIDRRDRALISFLLLTGIRYTALCSLALGCLDADRLVVYQYPRWGVKTKGGKVITTRILQFDSVLVEIVVDWAKYLAQKLKYTQSDPLFPRTAIDQADDGFCFEVRGLTPQFWSGGNSIREILKGRFKQAGLPYFNPHSFRRAACLLAMRMSRTPEEFKALSQNFGHEDVLTTLRSYGTLDDDRVAEVISRIDFSGTEAGGDMIPASEVEALLKRSRKQA